MSSQLQVADDDDIHVYHSFAAHRPGASVSSKILLGLPQRGSMFCIALVLLLSALAGFFGYALTPRPPKIEVLSTKLVTGGLGLSDMLQLVGSSNSPDLQFAADVELQTQVRVSNDNIFPVTSSGGFFFFFGFAAVPLLF